MLVPVDEFALVDVVSPIEVADVVSSVVDEAVELGSRLAVVPIVVAGPSVPAVLPTEPPSETNPHEAAQLTAARVTTRADERM